MKEEKGIVKYQARDGQELALNVDTVKKYLVSGKAELVTDQEIMYFLGVCKSRGLNPFKRDCYLIKYSGDPAAIITSIDYFRSRAKAQKDCTGWKKGIIVQTKEGEIKDSSGLILDDETLLGGFFEAIPTGWREPFRLEVNLAGYIKKTKDGRTTKFWQKDNQPSMIAKVAEGQGLRTLWPDEFQGLYEESEIVPRENVIDIESIPTGQGVINQLKDTPETRKDLYQTKESSTKTSSKDETETPKQEKEAEPETTEPEKQEPEKVVILGCKKLKSKGSRSKEYCDKKCPEKCEEYFKVVGKPEEPKKEEPGSEENKTKFDMF